MRRTKAMMLGAAAVAGFLVLAIVSFGVISTAAAFRVTPSDASTATDANTTNTTNGTGLPPGCGGHGLPPPPPPLNGTGNSTRDPNGTGLPPPPTCGGPGAPPAGAGGCSNMTAPSNGTADDDDRSG
jgi:hypothetical protein